MTPIDFSRLEKLSQKINEAWDVLSKSLASIKEKLDSLNLGIETWVPRILVEERGKDRDENPTRIEWQLGYASLDGKWGLLARLTEYIVPDREGEYEPVLRDDD